MTRCPLSGAEETVRSCRRVSDVTHGVKIGFGIHDASAFEYEIVLLRGGES